MNDYDKALAMMKALAIVQDRINDQYRINDQLVISCTIIKSFYANCEKYLFIQYTDGTYMFILDENESNILSNISHLSSTSIFKLLIKNAKEHNIYLGKYDACLGKYYKIFKILSKGETLDSLCIEYDMKYV